MLHKRENLILVKGFKRNGDGTLSCRDFNFGPESEIIGKTFTLDNDRPLVLCGNGFHACDGIGKARVFYDEGDAYFKISVKEAYFDNAEKCVFREFTVTAAMELPGDSNTGNWNTGSLNTGNSNSGDRNTGNRNTGNRNTGNSNSGDWNSGDLNSGDLNTGNRNTGDLNSGNWNTGNRNTGDSNSGNWNTGNRNTGDWNTGDRNTGYRNTGYWNTGDRNTGDSNTGNSNTGNSNTGNRNSGNWNTGNWNTGDWNTGNWNIGDRNTGGRNLCNYSAGFFCYEEPKATCFGLPTELTFEEFQDKYSVILEAEPTFEKLMKLPNATEDIVNAYLEKMKNI